jgi:hypothetical protein
LKLRASFNEASVGCKKRASCSNLRFTPSFGECTHEARKVQQATVSRKRASCKKQASAAGNARRQQCFVKRTALEAHKVQQATASAARELQ